jgi:four helix bundle protein
VVGSLEFGVWSLGFGVVTLGEKTFFMATINRFEDLEVWQLSRKLCQKVYPLTFEEPICKDFRYKDQIRGTCGSVMDNIAEGFGRGSKNEFVNALTTAKGEAEELKSQLYRGLDAGYFSEASFNELYDEADLLVKKIGSFIQYLNKSNIKGQKFKERN